MTRLTIRHETLYTYQRPVSFSAHRLLLRPRDSHAIRLVDASLELSPPGSTRWVYDALGNCVCWFTPLGAATELRIVSRLVIDRYPAPLAPLPVSDPHTASPIVYERPDRLVLEPFIEPVTDDEDALLLKWLRDHLGRPDEPAVDFLQRMTHAIHSDFLYNERQSEGVQSPAETLRRGSGSCRDFAWLMIEALRRLGYAARFITGYIYSPASSQTRGAQATHAWCEVFLPGQGWMEFDPTNGLAESADLIRVATVRTPQEASPVSGLINGDPGGSNLFVSVTVDMSPALEPAAA